MAELGDNVDRATFDQILEMDDSEEDREFSKPLIMGFFEQAAETFDKMDVALKQKNLKELYALGHFLKGSSATLGFTKVRDSCQIIQQYGNGVTLDNTPEPDQGVCISQIASALTQAKRDMEELKKLLLVFFNAEI
ncbi:hypothetical protein GGTG_12930 [Gaeumannomyces tritici R3-111a-1]|uniref:HPt domain-containing protein n=1 Tax=Gaeumannomyces tritici (strain R3-111a-1) TaxID=644352 RepID=J3PHF1_GAET3|nr:hypothetical protein GGTG_12930 [Gaeumannomyces tritici R3-111a-1]EJT69311.1 hypothetical protein GGTG_12930 [Gaeumannomyces tritici R3-111a-1]